MKKVLFSIMTLVMVSCGGNQNKGGDSIAADSTGTSKNASEDVAGEMQASEAPATSKVTAIEFTAKNERQNADFYYTTITAHINLEDGTAYVKYHSKCVAQYTKEVIYDNSDLYEGSWKSISVKRGNQYLDAYDIECDNKNGHMEIYATVKLDYMFCNHFSDDPYWKFHEGQTGYARKIIDKREITEAGNPATETENPKENLEAQSSMVTGDNNGTTSFGYEVTSTRILTEKDIVGISKSELRIIRNEIYARHGYIFNSADLKQHFSKFSWYKPVSADVSASLSDIEKANVAFLKKHE